MSMVDQARSLWHEWGDYAKHTCCEQCERFVYCRQHGRRGRWLCLDCFDLSVEARRWLRGR